MGQTNTARAAAQYLLLALLVAAPGCEWFYTADRPEVDPSDAAIVALDVVPQNVYVSPGDIFVMRARMLDGQNGVLPKHDQLAWTRGTGLTELGRGGDSIVVKAAATSGANVRAFLKAQVGAYEATAWIVILDPAAAGTVDSVWSDYALGAVPDAVLIDDTLAATPVDDSLVAFVEMGLLGDLSGGTGEIARFSSHEAFRLQSVPWDSRQNTVDLRTSGTDDDEALTTTATLPRSYSYTIWIASSASDSRDNAEADAEYASGVLTRQRTGLALQHVIKNAAGSGAFTVQIDEDSRDCIWVPQRLFDLGVPSTGDTFAAESLNVVYVDQILAASSNEEVDAPTILSGFSCQWDPNIGLVIIISKRLRGGGTLTHELGHALGLRAPYGGHTLLVDAFSYTNLMWPYEWDAVSAPRSTFSLGQVFRINLDKQSWIARLSGVSRLCDPLGIDRSCPILARDLLPLP
jgi:hypothetical protein